jgi:hypothetical protein
MPAWVEQFQSSFNVRNSYSSMIDYFMTIDAFFCVKGFKKDMVAVPD